MNKSSRRHFLAVTGAGAAAAGAATVLPASLASAQTGPHVDNAGLDALEAPLADTVVMACVTDLAAGELTVINGANETTITDGALAQRLVRLSGKGAA